MKCKCLSTEQPKEPDRCLEEAVPIARGRGHPIGNKREIEWETKPRDMVAKRVLNGENAQ